MFVPNLTDNEVKANDAISSNTGNINVAYYEEINMSLWDNAAHNRKMDTTQAMDAERIEMPTYTNVVYPAPTKRNIEMASNVAYGTTEDLHP